MAKIKKENSTFAVEKYDDLGDMSFEDVLGEVKKKFGQTSVMFANDKAAFKGTVIPTDSLLLNKSLVIGGLPAGRIVEIYGGEGSGKTTLALGVLANAQKMGGRVAFLDAEHALDPSLATGIGVDIDDMLLSQPDSAEQGLEMLQMLVASNKFSVIVVDSVAALAPLDEINGEMDDVQMGLQARILGKGIRKVNSVIGKTNTCVIFINQLRSKLGITFGNPNDTPGGRALKFFSSMRIEVARTGALKKGDDVIGNNVKITVVKNKLAPPFRHCETELYFGKGFVKEAEMVDIAVSAGIFRKSSSWLYFKENKFSGKQAAVDFLRNPDNFAAVQSVLTGTEETANGGSEEVQPVAEPEVA